MSLKKIPGFAALIIFAFTVVFSLPAKSLTIKTITGSKGWVDSLMKSLTLDQKIAQLIFIRAYSNKDNDYNKRIANLIRDYQVGGITFFQGGPLRQAELTNAWQAISGLFCAFRNS